MKVAVASMYATIDTCVGTQLHRSNYLLIIDLDTIEYEVMQNPILVLSGPAAGKLFAQQLLQENVSKVLVNNCSPDLRKSLGLAGIQIVGGINGSVRSAIGQFKEVCIADTIIMSTKEIQE
jgi:predicted Fe-Mo cluster-binding NifX family protein